MYSHLLVPIDGSMLSNATADQAVRLAAAVGARITFVHALHGHGGAALAATAADTARIVAAKAEAAARAGAVEADGVIVEGHAPHEAILQIAKARHCDLIFMSTRGRRGLKGALLGSVARRVLEQATVPVTIAAVASNHPLSAEQRAISIIRDEHRSLAAVIHALVMFVDQANPVDPRLLRAMLSYIQTFPQRLHHPKEDVYLFARLRQRTRDCDVMIDELQLQHKAGDAAFAELSTHVEAVEAARPGALESLRQSVHTFAEQQWQHMSTEERVALPAAQRYLTEEDWSAVATAFGENGDPRFDLEIEESFDQIASRLLRQVERPA
jgi:nucleotide-binding universal stress UspA family protein/hemerythrin-like domain-containing protein